MVKISFTKFRQNAKTYFDKVEKGEVIRIYRHGKVVAEIISPRQSLSQRKKNVGLIIPGVSLSRAIIEERRSNPR